MRTAAYGTQGFRRQQAVVHRISIIGTLNGGEYRSFSYENGPQYFYPVCLWPRVGIMWFFHTIRGLHPEIGLSWYPYVLPLREGLLGGWQSGGIESGQGSHEAEAEACPSPRVATVAIGHHGPLHGPLHGEISRRNQFQGGFFPVLPGKPAPAVFP